MSDTIAPDAPIYVAGHRGMVGSALMRRLQRGGYTQLITRTRADLDLTDQAAVRQFLQGSRPAYVFVAAARVGGIVANDWLRADFLVQNLAIALNVIHGAFLAGVQRLMFLGSSCVYPRLAPQPMREDALLGGPLEPTNEAYAIAKIAGIKLCEALNDQYGTRYVSVMPTNLYGPNDSYDLATSHVLPALLRKAHESRVADTRTLEVWGSGNARREFLHADDLADACVFLMEQGVSRGLFNIGTGVDISIRELALLILEVVGHDARLEFDPSKPDGAPRKLLDVSRMSALGWHARIPLSEGLRRVYAEYRVGA